MTLPPLPPLPTRFCGEPSQIAMQDYARAYGAACAAAERDELAAKHYAAPQQRQPLTDEQISSLFANGTQFDWASPELLTAFARAIERAHGIVEAP